ncbi:TetR/AcrR family transcriptional regulator [Bacillus salitolerans]|uniref:TetR/AcrR family transcriptional regulator n=1 Tax=Bacillus salitolerans TaxID=1437434 RepID=A0ABW4LVL3_9BACI
MSPKVSKEHREQRRANIIKAATNLFIDQGYERTTMEHVMDAAKISKGGLYQYFSNKENLFETILEEDLHRVVSETEQILEGEVESYWNLLLLRMFGDQMEPTDRMDPLAPSKLEFFLTGRSDERRRAYGNERYSLGVKLYADIIAAGQRHGEFSNHYCNQILARTIVTFVDGLAVDDSHLSKENLKMKEQYVMFLEYLMMALNISGSK